MIIHLWNELATICIHSAPSKESTFCFLAQTCVLTSKLHHLCLNMMIEMYHNLL